MQHSRYISSSAVANNSIAVLANGPCSYCDMYFYCYSEATTGRAYLRFPNNVRIDTDHNYEDVTVQQTHPPGVRVNNLRYKTPDYFGVYTCEMPDSRGSVLHFSVVWYTSLPGMHY